ncbi:MAG: hypothetical protein H6779_03305 [Candidatus Nomurabacteria bacterium]|nr:hypothetical protein [Candidatus Nomurabacteria bacterium]USN87417.1 MAG: hypothetical protein H6779_03305 [Candidatus Nomurabacteria bacterium]
MKRFSEQLNKKADSLKMKEGEKRELRERLVSYMEYHPLPKTNTVISSENVAQDMVVKTLHIHKWKFLQWSGAVMATLVLVIPYVAERAVPGDVLYSVKVNLNEEVRGTLARSSYDKVVWETERLNRRIAEARLLASEGKMTEEIEESVAEAVRVHSENARKEIENIKQTDEEAAILATIQLDTTLDIQSTSLKSTQKASTTPKNNTDKIVDVLAMSHLSESEELPSYERLIGRVESETTRAYELLNNIEENATDEEKADIKRRLEDIERKTATLIQDPESATTETREGLVETLQKIQKLIVFMTNIDVRETLTVDEIVPVTLTEEERREQVQTLVKESERLILYINKALETSDSLEINDKISQVVRESEEKLDTLNLNPESEEYDLGEAESSIHEIHALLQDSWVALDADEDKIIKLINADKETGLPDTATTTEVTTSTTSTSSEPMEIDEDTGTSTKNTESSDQTTTTDRRN